MKFPATSITAKLLLLFLPAGLVSVAVVGMYSYYSARQAIISRTIDQLISVRAVKKQQIEYFFNEKIKNLGFLARGNDMRLLAEGLSGEREKLSGPDMLKAEENIRSYYRNYGFSNLYIISRIADGSLLFRSGSPGTGIMTSGLSGHEPGENINEGTVIRLNQLWNEVQISDSVRIFDLFRRFGNDTLPVILMGQAIWDHSGKVSGAVALEISSSDINRIMLQNNSAIGLGQSGEAYLVGTDHLMRSASRLIPHSVLTTRVNSLSLKTAVAGRTGALETPDYRNIDVFSAYEPLHLPALHWIVLAEIDYAESVIPVRGLRNDILLVSLIISLFILAIARIISGMVTQPVIALKKAATKLGLGDYSTKVEVRSGDEIGALAGTFNTMADRIREERERRLSAVYDGQEMERQRISRELHDGLGQRLVGAKLQLENCEGQDFPCLQKTYQEIKGTLVSLIDETRQISNDLMPPALTELGLVQALGNLCRNISQQSGLAIDFYSHGAEPLPGNKSAVYIYRIAQEALSNTIRHSGASNISMQLTGNKEYLIFLFEDNGKGFEPERAGAGPGNGLSNMRERAMLLGGTFNLETSPGMGTTIRVKIPRQK